MSNKQKRTKLDEQRATKHIKRLKREGRFANGVAMPKGAIAADLTKHPEKGKGGLSQPLFYTDQHFTCRDCGSEEVWTAKQQQWYYEVAKGTIYGRAVRCGPCRRKHRELIAKQRSKSSPKN